jgi:hypothetical protein
MASSAPGRPLTPWGVKLGGIRTRVTSSSASWAERFDVLGSDMG